VSYHCLSRPQHVVSCVLSGPDAGNIHVFLATPIDEPLGLFAPTHPQSSLPANVGKQSLPVVPWAVLGEVLPAYMDCNARMENVRPTYSSASMKSAA
jgi:hypothetical protein